MKRILIIFIFILSATVVFSQKRHTGSSKKAKHTAVAKKSASKKKAPAKKTTVKNTKAKKASKKQTTKKNKSTRKSTVVHEKEHDVHSAANLHELSDDKTDDKTKTVVITSEFKPTLRNSGSKVNLTAAVSPEQIAAPELQYTIPAQNLFFNYQATAIKPLALKIDSGYVWENKAYIKAGFGNYATPFFQGAISFGDGKTNLSTFSVEHIQSKGSLPYQQYSKTNIEGKAICNIRNTEWTTGGGFKQGTYYEYGYLPNTLDIDKSDLRRRYTSIQMNGSLRNKESVDGINYSASVQGTYFKDNRDASEILPVIEGEVSKDVINDLTINLGTKIDLDYYKNQDTSFHNHIFSLKPFLQYTRPYFKLTAGFTPTWQQDKVSLLPNFTADMELLKSGIILQAGWIGYYDRMTYHSLSEKNHWIQQPDSMFNTRMLDYFVGIKASVGNHLTFNGKLSIISAKDYALFANDTITGQTFEVLKESGLNILRLHGEAAYTVQEKFSIMGGVTFNQYGNLVDNAKAWQMVPLEFNGSLLYQLMNGVSLKTELFYWSGAQCRTKSGTSTKLSGALDVNAGVDFKVIPRLSVWAQFNNILNNKYQRWNQYEVLGLNAMAGIIYSFDKIR